MESYKYKAERRNGSLLSPYRSCIVSSSTFACCSARMASAVVRDLSDEKLVGRDEIGGAGDDDWDDCAFTDCVGGGGGCAAAAAGGGGVAG